MASNDMNSWDKDPDEWLRRRWQQTFADFEVQPQESARQRVLDSLERTHRRRRIRWVAMAGILLLLIAGMVYQVGWDEPTQPTYGPNPATRSAHTPQPRLADQPYTRMVPGVSTTPRNSSATTPALNSRTTRQVRPADTDIQQSTVPPERSLTQAPPSGPYSPTTRHQSHANLTAKADPNPVRLSRHQLDPFVGTGFFNPSPNPIEAKAGNPASRLVEQSISKDEKLIVLPSEQTESSRPNERPSNGGSRLRPRELGHLATSLGLVSRRLPAMSIVPVPLATPQTGVDRQPWRPKWFVEAVPLSSFQWMSAPRASSAYLSQVSALAAFSPTTWGYQVNGGIRFRRWQAYLATGQLRRWAYYTVRENQYRVVPSASDPNQLVTQTHAVVENVSLPLLGIGVSQYQSFSRDRYVLDVGGQISYLPTSDQPLAGLRAGLSRQIRLRQQLAAQVGVTVEYGLNRLLDEQRQLVIRPLVVGFSIRIQPPVIR